METTTAGGYYSVLGELRKRLAEPAPGRIQLLTGPRQVGKTTLLLGIAQEFGSRALYLAADTPVAASRGWWERQWQRAEDLAARHTAVVLLDEIQYLPDWSRLLKAQVDRVRRLRLPLHVVATGSAALRLGTDSRETMAGRFERLGLSHWPARDLVTAFGLSQERSVQCYVRWGAFPGAVDLQGDLARWRAYVRDSIVEPATGRDLVALRAVRRPALLRQVFAIAASHPTEIISLRKLAGALIERGTLATISHYLRLLDDAYLVAGVPKFAKHELRRRASPPKLIPLSNAFLAVASAEEPPTPERDPERWGRWVENACLAFMVNSGQTVHYWRESPLEVDAIVEGSWGRWAIEIKTATYTWRDLAGLFEFTRRFRQYRPLVLCRAEDRAIAQHAGAASLAWGQFLWSGVEGL